MKSDEFEEPVEEPISILKKRSYEDDSGNISSKKNKNQGITGEQLKGLKLQSGNTNYINYDNYNNRSWMNSHSGLTVGGITKKKRKNKILKTRNNKKVNNKKKTIKRINTKNKKYTRKH